MRLIDLSMIKSCVAPNPQGEAFENIHVPSITVDYQQMNVQSSIIGILSHKSLDIIGCIWHVIFVVPNQSVGITTCICNFNCINRQNTFLHANRQHTMVTYIQLTVLYPGWKQHCFRKCTVLNNRPVVVSCKGRSCSPSCCFQNR